MLINLWLTVSLYPNSVETENSKPKPCIEKRKKEIKQCTNLTNAEKEQTPCFESWRKCINKALCKKERKQKGESCLNERETECLLCESIATTYFLAFKCKNKKNARRLVENMVIKTDIKIIMILTEDLVKNYLFKICQGFFRVFAIDLKQVIHRSIQNLVHHLRWNVLEKEFTDEILQLFSQKSPYLMFCRARNTPL